MKRIAFVAFFLIFCACDETPSQDPSGNDDSAVTDKPDDSSDNNSDDNSGKGGDEPAQSLTCDELSSELPNEVGFNLVQKNQKKSFFKEVHLKEIDKRLPEFISYKLSSGGGFFLSQKKDFQELEFYYKGIPLCHYSAKAFPVLDEIIVAGDLPSSDLSEPDSSFSPFLSSKVFDELESRLNSSELNYKKEKELCYEVRENKLLPAWRVKLSKGKLPYEVLIHNEEILSLRPLFFQETGTFYVNDESDDLGSKVFKLKKYDLEGVASGGELCTEEVHVVPQFEEEVAKSTNLVFEFDPETNYDFFAQTSAFVYANLQARYIEGLNFLGKWYGPQILIVLDKEDDGLNNGAQYIPSDGTSYPVILLPKGDGVLLVYVDLDNEAVQHEMMHHRIFYAITYTRGESLVLHEGLADTFVMLRTKSPCLGEHLCVNDSLCVLEGCLRTAENDYRVDSPYLPSSAHLKSQLISGLFWDLALLIGYDEVANWLNYSIDYLPKKADFEDLAVVFYYKLISLYEEGKIKDFDSYCSSLMEVYEKRGFNTYLEGKDLSCDLEALGMR